jgi:Protein of unknown function (DUF3568)
MIECGRPSLLLAWEAKLSASQRRFAMRASVMICVLVVLACALGCSSSYTTGFGSEASFNKLTGDLDTIVEADLDRAYGAGLGAVEDMQLTLVSKAKDVTKGMIVSKMADTSRVQITLEKRSEHVTGVTVGVASMGKESVAREVLDKMVARLKGGTSTEK